MARSLGKKLLALRTSFTLLPVSALVVTLRKIPSALRAPDAGHPFVVPFKQKEVYLVLLTADPFDVYVNNPPLLLSSPVACVAAQRHIDWLVASPILFVVSRKRRKVSNQRSKGAHTTPHISGRGEA